MRVGLPSYAFQRERFWFSAGVGVGDMASVGQVSAGHPLLGAVVELAGGGGCVLTGRLSLESHPWLADHAVSGVVLLAGTAFLELVLHAGARVGCPVVQELTLQAPLVLPEGGGVQVQVVIGDPGEAGERPVACIPGWRSSGAGGALDGEPDSGVSGEGGWTRHASGMLTPSSSRGSVVRARIGRWIRGRWSWRARGRRRAPRRSRSMTPMSAWPTWAWSTAPPSRV